MSVVEGVVVGVTQVVDAVVVSVVEVASDDESEVVINPEDEWRLNALKEALRRSVTDYVLNQPLLVLLNKSENGFLWKESNMDRVIKNSLKNIAITSKWLSYHHLPSMTKSLETPTYENGNACHICKVNDNVYFCFNLQFAPMSRCLKNKYSPDMRKSVSSKSSKGNVSEYSYENSNSVNELLSKITTDFTDNENVHVLTPAYQRQKLSFHIEE